MKYDTTYHCQNCPMIVRISAPEGKKPEETKFPQVIAGLSEPWVNS